MSNQVQPKVIRLVTTAMVSIAVVVIAIGLWLWLSSDDGSVPGISVGLWALGAAEMIGAATFGRIIARQSRGSGYDGAAATYQDGDLPPGMLQ